VVSSKHNEDPELAHPIHGRIGRLVLALDDAVIAISTAVADHLVRVGRADRRRIHRIYYGIDPREPETPTGPGMREEFGFPPTSPLVLLVGRLEPQKDIPTFLEAAAIVTSARPDTRFAIVGAGSLEKELRRQSRSLGLTDRVAFTGFRPDVRQLYPQADLVALTSRWEGFGLVLVEAMAAARPIVATSAGPIPEVVGDAGILVEPGRPDAVASGILRLLDDRSLADSLGRAGFRRVRERFSTPRMVERTTRLYEELLQRRKHRR
jgi:glycosyltransferase involved in cell wall biosynthesis